MANEWGDGTIWGMQSQHAPAKQPEMPGMVALTLMLVLSQVESTVSHSQRAKACQCDSRRTVVPWSPIRHCFQSQPPLKYMLPVPPSPRTLCHSPPEHGVHPLVAATILDKMPPTC